MKTQRTFSPKKMLLPLILFFATSMAAQDSWGGPSLSEVHYNDSITSDLNKTPDGCYYKTFTLTAVAGSRMCMNYSAWGPSNKNLSLLIINANDRSIQKRYYCSEVGGHCFGRIELDTVLSEATVMDIVFTTTNPGETFSFTADAYYGSADALEFQANGNLCWKIGYILKNSENGYQFITVPDADDYETFSTTAPIIPEAPGESYIVKGLGSISYFSTIQRGAKEESMSYYDRVAASMKNCMGEDWKYESTTDAKGNPKMVCIMTASTNGVQLRNLSYLGEDNKDELPKYQVTVYVNERMVQGNKVYEVCISISNLFYQF